MKNNGALRLPILTCIILLVLVGILVMALAVNRDRTCQAFSSVPQEICAAQPLRGYANQISD